MQATSRSLTHAPTAKHVSITLQLGLPWFLLSHLREDARMSIEEILVEDGIVVGECLGQTREARRWYFLQRCLVGLVSHAADIQSNTILRVGHVSRTGQTDYVSTVQHALTKRVRVMNFKRRRK